MKMIIRFSYHFSTIIWHLKSVLIALFAMVLISAGVIAKVENLPFGDAMYFTFHLNLDGSKIVNASTKPLVEGGI
jgi:hypothetical protein